MSDTTNKYMTQAEKAAEALPGIEQKVEGGPAFKVVNAATVIPEEVKFLWKPYILRGDVTILAAAGGTGKTFAMCGIIAELSRGRLPLNAFEKISPVKTLFISAEDEAFILRDRLEKAGADLSKISILDANESVNLTLSDGCGRPDMTMIESVMKQCTPDLVVIDPLHAIIGSEVKMTEQNVIRPFMQALASVGKKYNAAIVDVAHVSKRSAGANANDAILGATDIVNAARSVLRVIFDETGVNQNRRVIVHTKSNYAAAGQSIAFEIQDDGSLTWTEYADVTKEDMESAARNNKSIAEYLAGKEASRRSSDFVVEQIEALARRQKEKRAFYSYKTIRSYGVNGKTDILPNIGELSNRGILVSFPESAKRERPGMDKPERGIELILDADTFTR